VPKGSTEPSRYPVRPQRVTTDSCAEGLALRADRARGIPGVSEQTLERFRQTYRAHFPALSGYCASLVGDRDVGAELAQEAFARLFARWRGVRDPRAFLFFVGTNLATDHWRGRKRDASLLLRLVSERGPGNDRPRSDVAEAVESLPRSLRTVVLLHYYADLPLSDIAELTHRPLGTVKRHLHEARSRLRDVLERS